MKIYLMGASAEMALVKSYAERLEAAGAEITHKWWVEIEKVGQANPNGASKAAMRKWARADLDSILCATGFASTGRAWLLVPQNASSGAWVEFGYALATCFGRQKTFVSGDWRRSIFCAMADEQFDSHDAACERLLAELAEESDTDEP